jgi:UDP-N-acetyl-D-mannosaminouronate:lipid I N-acetyl-D-mannosaminouronosyltransferase
VNPAGHAGSGPATGAAAVILGFRIVAFRSVGQLLDELDGRHTILVALNAEKLARGDPRIREIANRGIGYADGYGAVLAVRRKGARSARIAGADLWLSIVERYARSRRFYIVGSTEEVIRETVERLRRDYPPIEIVGHRDGFMDETGVRRLADDLQATRPDIVFMAMGSPRQELLMHELSKTWPALYMGLGGSLDVYTGRRRRAPRWVQRTGLEWIHRFAVDPRRLHRLPAYLQFAWRLACNRL